jgi:hypothetical protein
VGGGVAGTIANDPQHGKGLSTGNGRAGTARPPRHAFDQAEYDRLAKELKDRGNVQTAGLERKGAQGDADRVTGSSRPYATVLSPTAPPRMQMENGGPFTPKFKTLQFAAAPFLPRPFEMDGDFEKWKDIPSIDLRLERFDGRGIEGLRVEPSLKMKMAWDGAGLYFMITAIDPNRQFDMPSGAGSFWTGDTTEVWVDMLNSKERRRARGTGQQFWCWPFGSQGDANLCGGEAAVGRDGGLGFYAMGPAQMGRAAKKTDDGYLLEFHIPAERLRDGELVAGKIVGMNVNVETGTKVQYYWSSSKAVETYVRPDTWGDVLLGGADGTLEIPAKLGGEGAATEATETRNAFVIGEPLRLRVTDRDMNLNPRHRDKVAVTVRSARGEPQVAVLEETDPESGTFEGAVRTALALGEPVPATLSVYEGESVTVTYVDQARANGARNADLVYTVRAATPLTTAGNFAQ